MLYYEVKVLTRPEAEEAVAAVLTEAGAAGVVVELGEGRGEEEEQPARPLCPPGLVGVKAYYPADESWPDRLAAIREKLNFLREEIMPGSVADLEVDRVAEEEWAESWKKYFHPLKVGEKVVVVPSWEEYRPSPGEVPLLLDPGMAFGTGTHPTTALSLQFLEKVIRGGEVVLDVGTGSGILALAAALLGAGRVLAVDVDPLAVEVAEENVRLNRLQDRVQVKEADFLRPEERAKVAALLGGERPHLVVANILARVIAELAWPVGEILAPGGFFIASGIVTGKAEMVKEKLTEAGLLLEEEKKSGEWLAFLCRKGS
ncbi:MAG: ribosomal protein methyltransferase [Eubacteriales bacterium]|nr:ribosomal protein methyltransferase [Eubacteriales bacterium]